MITRIIYDNDAAPDDAITAIYVANQPNVVIEGITIAGTGEAHGPEGAKNMAALCHMLGKPTIPIAYGSDKPCSSSGKPFPDEVRKSVDNIFDKMNVSPHPNPTITNSAVELIKKIVEKNDEKIVILATGPLTNIAEFIVKYPSLKNKIEKIVIMGGAVFENGNIQVLNPESDNTVAELNICADPLAAKIVFASKIPVTLVPLDATNQVPMTKEFYESLSHQLRPELKLIYQLLKAIIDDLGEDEFFKKFYLWDPLAAMICLHPNLATTTDIPILMDLETAETKPVKKGATESSIISVATKIPLAQLILRMFIEEIKSNLMNAAVKTTPTNHFQMPPEDKIIITQTQSTLRK